MSGGVCLNPAVCGSDFCRQHGDRPVNPAGRFEKGNTAAWRHGAYSPRLGGKSEEKLFQSLLKSFKQDFDCTQPADYVMAYGLAFDIVKLRAAEKAKDSARIIFHDRRINARRKFLCEQKARRDLEELNRALAAKYTADIMEACRRRHKTKDEPASDESDGAHGVEGNVHRQGAGG